MLNIFPGLLLPFLAPTLLRVGIAVAFAAIAYAQWKRRDTLKELPLPFVGRQWWWIWVSVAVHAGIAAMLFVGCYTQGAALAGALLALKHLVWAKRYPEAVPVSRATSLLMLLVCLSLVLSGAGAFAQDLPL